MAYQTVNPFTEETEKTFEEISKEALEDKLQKAATCFETWRKTSFGERKKSFKKWLI